MLYLEDYLEMIENLPMEMRDRFTEMREMDLQVANAMDSLEEKVKTFFKKCGTVPNLKQEWKDEQMTKIRQDYSKALEDADEKVQLANQIYELVERHLRKLDQEVSKFKMELEADNAGITEVLEKRALEAEKQTQQAMNNCHRAEKRKYSSINNHGIAMKPQIPEKMPSSLATELTRESSLSKALSNSAASSPAPLMVFDSMPKVPSISYNLGQVGSGSNAAIAVAASRAIGATLEMQQGRRTASLKASYEAVSKNVDLTKELTLGRELSINKASTSSASDSMSTKSSGSRKKTGARAAQQQQQTQQLGVSTQPALPDQSNPLPATDSKAVVEEGEVPAAGWQADPNEPRYCICNDVSYGDMVGCDNDDCPLEWFHYGCVGLQQAPHGKWYCPQCITAMKRRGRK